MRRKESIIKEMSKPRLLMHFGGLLRAGKINQAQYQKVMQTWNELHPKQQPIDIMLGAADRSAQSIDRTEKMPREEERYSGQELVDHVVQETGGVEVGDIDDNGNELPENIS